MKQKLGLACALIQKPRLLLLDEPSVGVDPISRRELWRLVYELVDQGIAVVWSTAYLDEAERCQSVLTLDQGRILYDGPPEELTARVAGRCFLVQGAERKRQVLARAIRDPEVVDGVIQGRSVRLVVKKGASRPRSPRRSGHPTRWSSRLRPDSRTPSSTCSAAGPRAIRRWPGPSSIDSHRQRGSSRPKD